jgi:hypothetical protein
MRPRKHQPVTAIATALLALLAAITVVPRSADAAPDAVEAYLATHPGGVRINGTQVSYGGGVFIVTVVPPPGVEAAPDCPSGWFCFYEDINYGYPRGQLSDCGWQDLAWWSWQDRTESVHYNMSTGSVVFINHAAGSSSHTNDVRLFEVNTVVRTIADVSPYKNMADHVYRFC